jgi:TPR repeat protein
LLLSLPITFTPAYLRLCETGEIVALRSAAHRGPTAPGIADDQFRLAVAIEEAARHCPTGKEDGLHEAYGWYGTAGAKNHAEAAYRAALYEMDRPSPEPYAGLAFLHIAASHGHAGAQARIAMCHLKGVGVERNVSYGLQLLVRAALMKLGGS